jgi:type VI secretion system protein ImpK
MSRDLIEKTYWASADLLSLATQIGRSVDLPPPDELGQRISEMFDRMARKCREVSVPEEDFKEAKYAICALLDEKILGSNWPGRNYWVSRPLQLVHFNENTAGEGFFTKLEAFRRNDQRVNVTAIYYVCLQLGFLGKYAISRGEGLSQLAEQIAVEIGRQLPSAELLAPAGEPKDAGRSNLRRDLPIVAVGLGILAVAFVVLVAFKVSLLASVASLSSRLSSATASAAPGTKP